MWLLPSDLTPSCLAQRPSNGLWNTGNRSGGCLTLAFRHLAHQLAPQDPRVPPRGSSSHPEFRQTLVPHIRFCSNTCPDISCPCRHRNPRIRMLKHRRRRLATAALAPRPGPLQNKVCKLYIQQFYTTNALNGAHAFTNDFTGPAR